MNARAQSFRLLLRVRYGECDQQGIVFNARYAEYVDVFMGELLRAAFGGYEALVDQHLDTHVVRYVIEWESPAKFDDVLALTISRLELGTTSLTAALEIRCLPGERLVARVEVVNVMVNTADGAKTPIPADCRERLRAAAAGATIDFSGGPMHEQGDPALSGKSPLACETKAADHGVDREYDPDEQANLKERP